MDRDTSESVNYIGISCVCFHIIVMRDLIAVLSIVSCLIVLMGLKTHSNLVVKQIDGYPDRLITWGNEMGNYAKRHGPVYRNRSQGVLERKNATSGQFTIIIVTFNELLLEKTYRQMLSFPLG